MLNLRVLFFFATFFLPNMVALAGELVLAGVYHGTSLYVQNPSLGDDKYCIQQVYVNDVKLPSVPKASAFEISLKHLPLNSKVVVKIYHADGCEPKIINANAIREKESFEFEQIDIDGDKITWVTKGEKKFGKYFVEKLVNNSWVVEAEISAEGKTGSCVYNANVHHHSGKNQYKIKYLEVTGKSFYSEIMDYSSEKEKIEVYPLKVTDVLNFSKATKYEILDVYGNHVVKGEGNKVDMSKYKTGVYYVNFDNRTEKIFKK